MFHKFVIVTQTHAPVDRVLEQEGKEKLLVVYTLKECPHQKNTKVRQTDRHQELHIQLARELSVHCQNSKHSRRKQNPKYKQPKQQKLNRQEKQALDSFSPKYIQGQ